MNEVDSLTINAEGKESEDRIFLPAVIALFEGSLGILRILDQNTLRWELAKASMSSPLTLTYTAKPRPSALDWKHGVGDRYVDLFQSLETGTGTLPAQWKAVNRAYQLLRNVRKSVKAVTFQSPNRSPVAPSFLHVQQNIRKLAETGLGEFEDWVSLEGILEALSKRSGNKFFIWDQLTGTKIECRITTQELLNHALDLLKLEKPRVAVYGKARYKNLHPVSVKVQSFEKLPEQNEHPGLGAVQGINITDGLDSVDYVRSLRDAQ